MQPFALPLCSLLHYRNRNPLHYPESTADLLGEK